jgi:acetyl esterase
VQERLDEAAAEGTPRPSRLSVEGARELVHDITAEAGILDDPEPVGSVRDLSIPGPSSGIPVRIYTPEGDMSFPILLWLHGGGWTVGGLDVADGKCRRLSNLGGCSVVSVDYRRAPENPFPAALEDAYAALEWSAQNPDVVLGDPERIAVGGNSSGGNLAAALGLLVRDEGGPEISHQVLGAPALDYRFDTASCQENAEGFGLTRADMKYFWNHYLQRRYDARHPYASPLQARDLTGLPSATVITSGFDPLRDDGVDYAERLRDAGIEVNHHHFEDMPHGVLGYVNLKEEVDKTIAAFENVGADLREFLGGD